MKAINIKTELEKVSIIIESIDESINDRLNKGEYASDDFKQNQRISNALLRVLQAVELLKHEI